MAVMPKIRSFIDQPTKIGAFIDTSDMDVEEFPTTYRIMVRQDGEWLQVANKHGAMEWSTPADAATALEKLKQAEKSKPAHQHQPERATEG